MRKFIVWKENLKPPCCYAARCHGQREIKGTTAWYFKSDQTFMCDDCVIPCWKEKEDKSHWFYEAEEVKFVRMDEGMRIRPQVNRFEEEL